jgi:hypothetical protein
MPRGKVSAAVVVSILFTSAVHAAESTKPLTLLCEGDSLEIRPGRDRRPVSMTIGLNFATHKAEVSGISGIEIEILDVTELDITLTSAPDYQGWRRSALERWPISAFSGAINPMTGETRMGFTVYRHSNTGYDILEDTEYYLKCRSRMF